MDVYKRLAVLVSVVDSGSMTRAARELTPSAVSQQMRRLERDVQLAIFRRSSGRLLLTSAGEALYEGGVAMLAATRAAQDRLADLRDRPAGELCVGLSPRLAVRHVLGALEPMLETSPELTVRVIVSDTPDALVEARSDFIVWAGELPSSNDVVGHVGDWEQIVCGSPAYLARRSVPETPGDLAAHDFVGSGAGQIFTEFVGPSGEHEPVRLDCRIAGNALAAADLAAAGFGLVIEALPGVAAALASGALVRVLPDWRLPPLPIAVLMPARTRQPAKVRRAVDALRRGLGALAPAGVPAGTSA
jgi:DNA-binding transcriptional LysR family regulator